MFVSGDSTLIVNGAPIDMSCNQLYSLAGGIFLLNWGQYLFFVFPEWCALSACPVFCFLLTPSAPISFIFPGKFTEVLESVWEWLQPCPSSPSPT